MELTKIGELKIVRNVTAANESLKHGWVLIGIISNNHPISIVLGKEKNSVEEFIDKVLKS